MNHWVSVYHILEQVWMLKLFRIRRYQSISSSFIDSRHANLPNIIYGTLPQNIVNALRPNIKMEIGVFLAFQIVWTAPMHFPAVYATMDTKWPPPYLFVNLIASFFTLNVKLVRLVNASLVDIDLVDSLIWNIYIYLNGHLLYN